MKRKLFSIILAAIFVISLVGCSSAKPEDTVDVFLKNTQELNLEKMAESMNPDLKDSFDEITSEESDDSLSDYLDYFRKNAAKMTYEIKGAEVDGDSAVVTVDFKYVDGTDVLEDAFAKAFEEAISQAFAGKEMSEDEIEDLFIETLNSSESEGEETFATKTVKIDCGKKDNKWYIDDLDEDFFDVIFCNYLSSMDEIDKNLDELE